MLNKNKYKYQDKVVYKLFVYYGFLNNECNFMCFKKN